MSNWPTKRLGEVAKAKGGKRLPKGMKVQDDPTDHRYIRVLDMTPSGLDKSSVKFISPQAQQAIARYTITHQDVYISIAGTIGRVGIVPTELSGSNLTENAAKITDIDQSLDHRFLAAYLQSDDGQAAIRARTVGTSQPKLALFRIEDIPIPLPPVEVQRRIASILAAYDELIENNLRRIEILEKMAQAVYREWFVEFRFPGYQNVEMVDSELGPVPEGWKIAPLSDITSTQYGFTASTSDQEVGPKFLRGMDFNKQPWVDWSRVPYCEAGREEIEKFGVRPFDILLIRMADPGKVTIVEKEIEAVFASYLVRVSPHPDSLKPYWLFYYFSSPTYQGYISGAATGTTRRSASAKVLTGTTIALPPVRIQARFVEAISPIRRALNNLLDQNANLRTTRDLLLPKLVSGEIDVSDLDIDTEWLVA